MISKELLTKVLKEVKNIEFERFQQNENYIGIEVVEGNYCHGTNYNIHHVAHMCKEWARGNGYLLYSVPDLCIVKTLNLEYCVDFGLSTEAESIFRACQWILDNKEQKC